MSAMGDERTLRRRLLGGWLVCHVGSLVHGRIPLQAGGLLICRRDSDTDAVLGCIWKSHTLPYPLFSPPRANLRRAFSSAY